MYNTKALGDLFHYFLTFEWPFLFCFTNKSCNSFPLLLHIHILYVLYIATENNIDCYSCSIKIPDTPKATQFTQTMDCSVHTVC